MSLSKDSSLRSNGPEPAIGAARPAVDAIWDRLAPHVTGRYANFASETHVAGIYPIDTYRRLAAVKHRYDPTNLFAGNHNIRPNAQHPDHPAEPA